PHKPVVCADPVPPGTVLTTAQHLEAHWNGVNEAFGFSSEPDHWNWWGVNQAGQRVELRPMPLPVLPLPGLAAALQTVSMLGIDLRSIACGSLLADLQLSGRFQRLYCINRGFILDVAHNPAATQYLAQGLQSQDV